MSASQLDGRWMVRISIGVEATTRAHVAKLWVMIQEVALEHLDHPVNPEN